MAMAQLDFTAPCSISKLWELFDKPGKIDWQSEVFHVDVLGEGHFIEHRPDGYMRFELTHRDFYEKLEFDVETDTERGRRIILFMEEGNGARIALMDDFKSKKLIGNPMLGSLMNKRLKTMEKDLKKYFR